LRERNIDKCSLVNMASEDFGTIIYLSLRGAIFGTQQELQAVRNFLKENRTALSEWTLRRLWAEMDVKNVPQHNGDNLSDIAVWVYRELQAKRENGD